jgi:hypothetical protein
MGSIFSTYVIPFFATYITPLIPPIAPLITLLGALVAYWLAKSAYFRQKEYELITERYLRQGLDRITDQVERSLGVFRHNWARSLTIVKMFRDCGKDMNPSLYRGGFIEPDPALYEVWVDYRIRDLIGDDIVNLARQSLEAFIRTTYAFFSEDLCTVVRLSVEGGKELAIRSDREEEKREKERIVENYFSRLKKLDEESQQFLELLGQLQHITFVLQTQRFSFKGFRAIRKKPEIVKSVEILHSIFNETPSCDQL